MLADKEHYFQKLKDKLLKIDTTSSNPMQNAKYLKQQNEQLYLKQISAIQDLLLRKMQEGDYIAYSLYKMAHEDQLNELPELKDWDQMEAFLASHPEPKDSSNNVEFYNPEIRYFASVLGAHEELWGHDAHP